MKYPPKLFLCIDAKARADHSAEIKLFKKKFLLKVITIGRNPNDRRSQVYYGVKEIKDYGTLIEINLDAFRTLKPMYLFKQKSNKLNLKKYGWRYFQNLKIRENETKAEIKKICQIQSKA